MGPPSAARVLLISDHGSAGGTRTYLRQLLELYRLLEFEVHLVCADAAGMDVAREPGDRYVREVTALAAVVSSNGQGGAAPWSRSEQAREREAFRAFFDAHTYDLVVTSVGTPGSLLAAVQEHPRGIYILHTYPHGQRVRLLGRLWFRHALDAVARTITVSHAAHDALVIGWGVRPERSRIDVVHSTMGPPVAAEVDAVPRDLILAAGHVEKYKGPDLFIDMAAQIIRAESSPTTRFMWAGDGTDLGACRTRVASLGLTGRVDFPGRRSDLDALYGRRSSTCSRVGWRAWVWRCSTPDVMVCRVSSLGSVACRRSSRTTSRASSSAIQALRD